MNCKATNNRKIRKLFCTITAKPQKEEIEIELSILLGSKIVQYVPMSSQLKINRLADQTTIHYSKLLVFLRSQHCFVCRRSVIGKAAITNTIQK